jgi:hypothetical protein
MSARTIASTFAATIAHIARDAQYPAQLDVVPRTLARARELVSAVHRVAITSARDACSSLRGTIRRAAHALGYERAVATGSPPRPAHTCMPAAGEPAVRPEATDVKPEAARERIPPGHAPTATSASRRSDDESRPPTTTDPIAAPPAPPTITPTQGAFKMSELIETIRAAVAQGATAEQKAIGAQACRTILTALDAEPGKPIVLPGAPKPHPLSGITVDQALDLLIARLTTIANAQETATAKTPMTTPAKPAPAQGQRGPRIPFIPTPHRSTAARNTPQRATRPVKSKP